MKLRIGTVLSSLLLVVVSVGLLSATPASAVIKKIEVTSSADPGSNDNACTLREAVQAASNHANFDGCVVGAPSGPYTIVFDPSINGQTITLGSGLNITKSMTVLGNGKANTVVTGNVINTSGPSVSIKGLTLQDVSNEPGTLTLSGVKVTDEVDNNTGSGETATVHIVKSQVVADVNNNSGIDATSISHLTISKSKIGGVIDNNSGSSSTTTLTVTSSKTGEIDNNSDNTSISKATITKTSIGGTGSGDGLDNGGAATTTISASTINGFDVGVLNEGKTVKLVNSTVTGSTSSTVESDSGHTTILNSTLSNGFTGILRSAGSVKVTNTIITAQTGKNCDGAVKSGGGNISDDQTCPFHAAGDRNNTNPKIGPPANNGGPTKTQLPQKHSPAIDHGLNPPCPHTDQRGKRRPQDGDGNGSKICDVGAVEVQP